MISIISGTFRFIKQVIIVVVLVLLINVFIFQAFSVSGSSMEPAFFDGDKVIAFKTPYFFNIKPDYDDIVVVDSRVNINRTIIDDFSDNPIVSLLSENRDDHIWIKRVIGLPGDNIELKEGKVYRNGVELNEDFIKEGIVSTPKAFDVPKDYVFVIGDNLNNSRDSREIGPIPVDNITGRVLIKYYPFDQVESF